MRVALAQIDTVVGDIAGNTARALGAIADAEAAGAGLTLLPELALTGYPPEDLLAQGPLRRGQPRRARGGRRGGGQRGPRRASSTAGPSASSTTPRRCCGNNRVLRVYHKRRCPTTASSTSERYFAPGRVRRALRARRRRCSTSTVCEDIWVPELVAEDAAARRAGACSTSRRRRSTPGKGAEREEMLRDAGARQRRVARVLQPRRRPGRARLRRPLGRHLADGRGRRAREGVRGGPRHRATSRRAAAWARRSDVEPRARRATRRCTRRSSSGCATTCARTASPTSCSACRAASTRRSPRRSPSTRSGAEHVHGVMMPSRYSSAGSVTDARDARRGARHRRASSSRSSGRSRRSSRHARSRRSTGREPDVDRGEPAGARARDAAHGAVEQVRLARAGDRQQVASSRWATRRSTATWSAASRRIKDVFKTRVYDLARWRNAQPAARSSPRRPSTKPPSAELRPGQLDQDSLPPYDVLDAHPAALRRAGR